MFTLAMMVLAAAPDAGVAARVKPALDAGVAVVEPTKPLPVEKPVPTPSVAEVTELKREVVELKSRTSNLERQASQADAMSSQLDKLSKQITELQSQLQESEGRRLEKERQVSERRAQSEQVVASIGVAQQQLATGNTSSVGATISYAERVFTGAALADVQSARLAIQNGDLGSARIWLSLAVVDAQAANR